MAATGKTPILLYGSTTATNTPSAGNLTNSSDGCEIAINVADKNLFFKDATNVVNTVPIRQSGTSSNGWLSSTDWNTFNNKQPAGTYVTSVTGTAPVVSSGGTTPAISMAAATGSVNGYLTSTDWTTFNGKQTALVSGTNIKTVSGTSLLGSGDVGTIGTGYGGTGLTSFTANGIVYASSTSALATNSNFFYDGTNVGLNTTLGAWGGSYRVIQIGYGAGFYSHTGIGAQGITNNSYAAVSDERYINTAPASKYSTFQNNHYFYVAPSGTAGDPITWTEAFKIDSSANATVSTGNLVIGTSGKGIDFSATAGTGTSELLADYEEGTFTPVVRDAATGTAATAGSATGNYVKVGREVTVFINFAGIDTTGLTAGNAIYITGLPYINNSGQYLPATVLKSYVSSTTGAMVGLIYNSASYMVLYDNLTTTAAVSTSKINQILSGSGEFYITATYFS